MANFIDYVKEYNHSFNEYHLNEIDSLIFSYLSYLHFMHLKQRTKIKDLNLSNNLNQIVKDSSKNISFLKAIVKSKRYQDVIITYPIEDTDKEKEKQFSAVTFLLPNDEMYIAFRGTDSTLIGWEEDFNMAFMLPIPSQTASLDYTKQVTSLIPRKFYLGGHSKGGNLAVYAASNIDNELSKRLIKAYSHDGPGFLKEFLTTTNYQNIKSKIEKTVPSSSIIGMLLFTNEHYKIIKSSEKRILEHDPFSWLVEDNCFITLKKLSDGTAYTNLVINDFISSLSKKEREEFINSLFTILKSTNLTTLDEISKNFIFKIPNILVAIYKLDNVNKRYLLKTIKFLILSILKNLKHLL